MESIDERTDDLPYGDERSRTYKAASGGRRCDHLLFIPEHGELDRFLPFADIRLMEIRKDGAELLIEFSATVVILTGKALRPVAYAVGARTRSRLEAFDPKHHDKPQNATDPYIARIRYYNRTGKKEQVKEQEPETKPMAEAH